MKSNDIKIINKKGWDQLVKNGHMYSNSSLPEYGYFLEHNEEQLNLIENVKTSKVLEIGCAEGKSLKYLLEKGASEVWGIDISSEQINKAKKLLPEFANNFLVSPMEELANIPEDYFDYVISIFSIGYCSDLEKTIKNIVKYLKKDGYFIMSWTHPLFSIIKEKNNDVVLNSSYFQEEIQTIHKGEDRVELKQTNFMISTLINTLISNGLIIDKIFEEKTILKDKNKNFKSYYFTEELVKVCPSTLILKCRKQ